MHLRTLTISLATLAGLALPGCTGTTRDHTTASQPAVSGTSVPAAVTLGTIIDLVAAQDIATARARSPAEPALVDLLLALEQDPSANGFSRARALLAEIHSASLRTAIADAYGLSAPPPPAITAGATPSRTAVAMALRRGNAAAYVRTVGDACALTLKIAEHQDLLARGRADPAAIRAAGHTEASLLSATQAMIRELRLVTGPRLLAHAGEGQTMLPLTIDCTDAGETLSYIRSLDSGYHTLNQEIDARVRQQQAAAQHKLRSIVLE